MYKRYIAYAITSILSLFLLMFIYQYYISPIYNYNVESFGRYAYKLGNLSEIKTILSMVVLFVVVTTLPKNIFKPSDFIIVLYYNVVVIPYMALFALDLFGGLSSFIAILSFIFFHSFYYVIFLYNEKIETISVHKDKTLYYEKIFFISILAFILIFSLVMKFGLSTSVSSLLDVYTQRAIFNNSSFIYQIIFSFLSFGVALYFIYLFQLKSSILLFIVVVFISLIIFLFTGSKMVFMGLLLTLLLSIIMQRPIQSYIITISIIFIFLMSIFLFEAFNNDLLLSLFVRRTFVLVSQICGIYFEHFTIYPYSYLAKYLHFIFDLPNSVSISNEIGSTYFLDSTHANSGIVSDAYGNFGLIGVFIYTTIMFIVFKILNRLNTIYSFNITPLFFIFGISLANSSMLAVILYQIFPFIIIFISIKKLSDITLIYQEKGKLK